MATRIRTLNFLPEIFKTPTNAQFLSATLDQLVSQPNTKRIEGYIGSKFGYGVNANDKYVTEPTKVRTDYQLEPGVVFTKANDTTATDFISYPGIIDALKLEGSLTGDNNRLFTSQFYSWDSFTDLDKIINYNQYYWLPFGPERVNVTTEVVYNSSNFIVQDLPNSYVISSDTQPAGSVNPTLTLLRGGSYTFAVNQDTQFWIQGEPGVTGFSLTQPNVQTRDVLGVTNNGASVGGITFNVPLANAQLEYNFPGNNQVGVISTLPFNQINGARVSDIAGIDGITALEGLTVMFYNTGVVNEYGYVQKFYDETLYDQNGGVPYNDETDFPGSELDYNNFEGGFYTQVNSNFYIITYVGDPENPTIQLLPYSAIPTNQKITAVYGNEWINRNFYRNVAGSIQLIGYNSSVLDTLYYQDGSSSNKVGIIKLVDSNETNQLNVVTSILGRKQYTSPTGVKFTNGMKVVFQGDIYPESYKNVEFYVEGVGSAIELVPVQSLLSPGLFDAGTYIPYDTTNYDIGNYDSSLYVPVTPDYITIARNAINRNAWSRSNRWFHIDVIKASAEYNNNPSLVTSWATLANKAKRPIIEFYPNLRMFNAGVYGKDPIDFIDYRTTDAFTLVAGQEEYYPDVAGYTGYSASIAPVTGAITNRIASESIALVNQVVLDDTSGLFVNDSITFNTSFGGISAGTTYYILSINGLRITISTQRQGETLQLFGATPGTVATSIYPFSTNITVASNEVFGLFQENLYITDNTNLLPTNSQISAVTTNGSNTIITVTWFQPGTVISSTNVASLVTADTTVDNYELFDGSRIVFAADTNPEVRNKIYNVRFSQVVQGAAPVITLTEADDGQILPDDQTAVFRGYNYQGKDFYFDGVEWKEGQQKTTVNQNPLFDIFDDNGISFGDRSVYLGTSFAGTSLFSYGIGTGSDDPVLGFPLRYSNVDNVGDISFDVTLNNQTFDYVSNQNPITQPINTGYVYNYTTRTSFERQLGWQTAVSPSVQYQIFEFDWNANDLVTDFICDVAPVSSDSTKWPTVQVFINNKYQDPAVDYTVTTTSNTTTVTIPEIDAIETVVQVLVLSDQVSSTAYYGVPTNLNNNPFNDDVTTVNIGDIRGQYQSSFYNNPDTTGNVFGPNNYRDLGNMVPWADKIIQNSASLVLPGTFLRKQEHNLFNALMFNSRQYITFKTLLVDTVNNTDYTRMFTPAQILDNALDQITASKTDSEPFFWSDMIPSKAAYISNTYSFANSLDVSIYPLSRIYDFTKANYYGVLVYLTRGGTTSQLIVGKDYVVSSDSPSLTVTLNLLPNDQITVNEFNQTYGSYIPSTPTKLGLYPATIPSVVLDSAYTQPTYFIVGHDGSYTRLFGEYDPNTGLFNDFRDQVLLEFETRVYNNLKLSNVIPVQEYEVLPGFFRETDYSYDEILQIYGEGFLNWVGQNRVDYKRQIYNKNNSYTFNYSQNSTKIDNQVILQGYWRGLYEYFYDTSNPDTAPWEMLGYTNMPTWWTTRYGPAPYTSENLILWTDLSEGIDWNNSNPVVIDQYIRPGLLNVIPVDSSGNLVSPEISILGNYNSNSFQRDWKVGDVGPTEFSYRRSSSYPFDLMRILALTKPAKFYNLAVDLDNYKYNAEFDQYLVNNRSHLKISDIEIYGSGTAKTSYINWIVDYEKQVGVDATSNITNLLEQLDVRLVYRVAGFSDKNMLKFFVEKSSANSNNSSLLIPDESYQVLLYDNQPFDRIVFSGVIVQITKTGYTIFGNSQTNAFFTVAVPTNNGKFDDIEIENLKVKVATTYTDKTAIVPYGTEFYSVQEVAQFLSSYGKYLENQGMVFGQIENGIPVTWNQMVAEFLYWAQMGWEVGNITTLNPAAATLVINKESQIVQPLTIRQQNFVLNQNLYPIQFVDLSIVRDGTAFTAQPLNQGDTISYGQFDLGNIEHGIVFNNVTLFNDIIYNLTTGLRQNRITVRGSKTADWNGTLDAAGFILNQDNIAEWNKEVKYTKGSIVKFKNKYWTALSIIQAKEVFDERDWKQTDYNEIQKGLLPNGSTRSYESSLYYDTDTANLEQDADLLSFSLIGYRPRDYLALADLTDITQVNVYKNLIKNKGTLASASAFKGATLPQGGIEYDIYENWAIKTGEFGGVLNNNFVEIKLNESELTGNPSIVGLTDGTYTDGVQQEVPLYSLFNYGRAITSPNVLPTIDSATPSTLFPTAGYVNFNDVKMSSYYYSGLSTARNSSGVQVPINNFYVRDYTWLANYLEEWKVYTPKSLGSVVNAANNLNGTVTLTFSSPHNLTKYQVFGVVNFDVRVDNYYLVAAVVDPYKVMINLTLNPNTTNITGLGVAFSLQNQRVDTPASIIGLPLLDNEFNKVKVWVDTNEDGGWAVYQKSLNYLYDSQITKTSSQTFGSAVAYTTSMGYLIGDSSAGKAYRYTYSSVDNTYIIDQELSQGTSFGETISYSDNLFVVSEPSSGTPKVYVYNLIKTPQLDNIENYQTISAPLGVTNWGKSTAISGDKNWIYISDIDNNSVHAYKKSQFEIGAIYMVDGETYTIVSEGTTDYTLYGATSNDVGTSFIYAENLLEPITGTGVVSNSTYKSEYIIDGDSLGLTSAGDQFGYSISTDYYGDTVVIGAPFKDYDVNTANYGYSYVFSRPVQNFEAQFTSSPFITQSFDLSWTPATLTQTATSTSSSTDRIQVSNVTGFEVGMPVVFSGTLLSAGALAENTVYYIESIQTGTNTFTVSSERNGAAIQLVTDSGFMTVTVQSSSLSVSINGTLIADNNYAVINSTLLTYSKETPLLNAGDILTVGSSTFVLNQTLDNQQTPRIGVEFGTSIDTNTYSSEILIGAPFELDTNNIEGAVHRFTNGGESYGIIVGTSDCNVTTQRTILLNGYSVVIQPGSASIAAQNINLANIPNVYALDQDGKLIISLVNSSLAKANNKLSLVVMNSATPAELGIEIFTHTQKIQSPHTSGPTQFGSVVKFNEFGSFVVSAPTSTRFAATTFDFIDDELSNDTVFDNNTTQFVDTFENAGAVYMFDYVAVYNEGVTNPGVFVYAQNTNDTSLEYGAQPMYGQALDFNENRVTIGTPNFRPSFVNGQVVTYVSTSNDQDWSVYRSSSPVVDINGIQNIQLFSAETNNTLENLDYIDPLQGKILGAVRENIDFISNNDPASYNSPNTTQSDLLWTSDKVGQLWFNTSNTRFVNYHQNDLEYNSKYWGRVFPGSDVAVYTWIESSVPPDQYTGPGKVFSIDNYVIQGIVNAEGTIVPVYYFWARNTNIVFDKLGKTLADSTIQSYIAQPQASGISYFTPLLPNAFALYNSQEFINATDTVLHVGFKTGSNDDVGHSSYSLIRANYADDFLPGVPGSNAIRFGHPEGTNETIIQSPELLYDRLLDSLCGVDETGAVVPNPFLPKAVQYGVMARPRQSFFVNRFNALKNYLQYANTVLAQFPITEIRNPSFLFREGTINPTTGLPFYDVSQFWQFINWWAIGYDNTTKSALQVPIYADLSALNVAAGTIVTVASNGDGKQETYVYETNGTWTRIGLENGTIEFNSSLWDYETARLGFGDNFFDTSPYDDFPSQETRDIIRSLNEEIYTNELLIFRNKSLILLFEYIQSETTESQNYLPWLNKTSFIDVAHTIRELRPIEVFQSDNQTFLEGYLNEVKPYHVVIKEFLFKYTGIDVYEGDITDFDLPAQYDTTLQKFISPELVYANPSSDSQFLSTDPIWQTSSYSQWYNNYGLSIVGEDNYPIAILEYYMSLTANSMLIDNANGFPVTGVVTIGTEQIAYSSVDLANNRLLGLTRGLNDTEVQIHVPGEKVFIDLPAVVVLNGGRGYSEPPKVIAYIDTTIYPAPRVAAQLEPIMGVDSVIGVNVINPGEGYVVLPKIIIDPAISVQFTSDQVNTLNSTVELDVPLLQTGDLIVYRPVNGSTQIAGLLPGQNYYIGVLETTPNTIIAFYDNYTDALSDQNRIPLLSRGTGNQQISVGATASCITSASPVRENNITLRFDRTSYDAQVVNWTPGSFYGSFYAGILNDNTKLSSSIIGLNSTKPPIDTILASAAGATFEVLDVTNDQQLTWSSRTRDVVSTFADDRIRINPSAGGSPVEGYLGSTVGFYPGMPVKFSGAVGNSGIVDNTIYYVKTLVGVTDFTISSNSELTDTVNLAAYTVGAAGLTLFVGEVVNTAVLTINYSGIRTATATQAGINAITVDLTPTGFNGTTGFYPGLPIYFVGNTFGNIIENEPYFVTTVIDNLKFTMSTEADVNILTVTETNATGNVITCNSTLSLNVNDPIIFTGEVFGGIVAGTTYYVRELLFGNTTFTISETINGNAFALTSDTGSCSLTSQVNTIQLTTGTGEMLLYVGLPNSPGQINGQKFTVYQTSDQFINRTGSVTGGLVEREITATVRTAAGQNRVCLSDFSGGLNNIYTNLDFGVNFDIGGLVTGDTYTVTGTGVTSITVTSTTAGNELVCADTSVLYQGMPILFTGTSLGQVSLNVIYYVKTIVNGTNFTISTIQYGDVFDTTADNGIMDATGEAYVTIVDTVSDETGTGTKYMTQVVGTTPEFDVSYVLGGYRVAITNAGSGFTFDNQITVPGTLLGGVSPANDLIITVTGIDAIVPNPDTQNPWKLPVESNGSITSAICSGDPVAVGTDYYFKTITEKQVEVYSNSLMTIPVSGLDFPYNGAITTTATSIDGSSNITVADASEILVADSVVFTGDVFGGFVAGEEYYVLSSDGLNTITVSTTLTGSPIGATGTGSMTVGKIGDFALLPEPFYFNTSIVKYNNRVYNCIVSNNDEEFIFGKWELLESSDRQLNALDRIVGYYQPTVNMPGLDLTQLVDGITYPNSTYKGNAFAPADEFTLDTILQDQPFYPTGINLQTVVWNGTAYLAASNAGNYSAINTSLDGTTWTIDNVAKQNINLTDLIFEDGRYVLTTQNNATPILISDDGYTWISNGTYTPFDGTPYDFTNFDVSSVSVPSLLLNGVTYNNGLYVAVGNNIITSTDLYSWVERFAFTNGTLSSEFNDVAYVSTNGFTGYVAVGLGQRIVSGFGIDVAIIYTSSNGFNWSQVNFTDTPFSLNSIASNGSVIVAVGDNGVIYTTFNTIDLFAQTSAVVENLNDVIWDSYNNRFVVVGNNGTVLTGVVTGDAWTTQITSVSTNIESIVWNNDTGEYIAVGLNNTILQSVDSVTWTSISTFTPEPSAYTVQGDAFTAGYGPEELVPGVVTDTLTMTVTTRPGTNWDASIYQHVGYNVVSVELTPQTGSQVSYSFKNVVVTPAQLSVFVIDFTTGLSSTIYEGIDYTIDWVNKLVILSTPLAFIDESSSDKLRIDVYEVGNGDQLVKANTETDPIISNEVTGFQEIETSANYSAGIWQGSGVIRPATQALEATAISTDGFTDAITCDDVRNFIINSPITFSGNVFGNIVEDQVYYVKSISYLSNRITISEVFNLSTGTAGSTFELSTATGIMAAIIQIGTGAVWTDPIVYHNGTKLVLGNEATVTRTTATTNTITTNTTGGLITGSPIVFSNTIFGGVIVPQQVYYVKTIVDSNEFTISEVVGGPAVELTDATGGASFITNDYAIGLSANGVTAQLIFAKQYDITVDYITYTLFAETLPAQYGYTIPEVQTFVGDGTAAQFTLTNFVGGDNPLNAVVEVNGVRLTESRYEIDPITNTILFFSPPAAGDIVAVTTYNTTDRQYLNTQFSITGSTGSTLLNIVVGSTTNKIGTFDANTPTVETFDQDTPTVVAFDESLNYLTLATGDTSMLSINTPIVFQNVIGGINAGTTYYVTEIIDSTNFVVSLQVGGTPFIVTTDSGSMTGVVNGLTVANIVNISNAISAPIATIPVSDTFATTNYITCNGTGSLVEGQTIVFKSSIIDVSSISVGASYQITELGTTNWNTVAGPGTWAVGDVFTAIASGTGTGTVLLENLGGINTTGIVYFIRQIIDSTTFTIEDQFGDIIVLSNASGNLLASVGGQPAVRVTTGINNNLTTNSIIRIDGTLGSYQLNNQIFYARVISDTVFDLYSQPYNPALNTVNYPVTAVNTYTSGGYVWLDELFTIASTIATATTSVGNRITVNSTSGLVVNTPIFFSEIGTAAGDNILGGIIANTEYYIHSVNPEVVVDDFLIGNQYEILSLGDTDWNLVAGTTGVVYSVLDVITVAAIDTGTTGIAKGLQEFKISTERYGYGSVFTLSDDTGLVNVSQFQQVNVDRLWVTINGYRVPSSNLRLNPFNNLSILSTVSTGDEVIITSMMPTATPNEEVYLMKVSTTNVPSVYRAATQTRTWLVEPLYNTQDIIYLNDATRITDTIIQEVVAPAPINGLYNIGLTADKNAICHITVFNNTTLTEVDQSNLKIEVENLSPILKISNQVSTGDSLTINTTEGRILYVNGEQIGFDECDLENNTVSGLTRGINGTGAQEVIPKYSEVFGLLLSNKMSDVDYSLTWNSYIYNTIDGDPLQISQTSGADFLRVDRT